MVGLPGLRGVEHVGFTVPDIEEATSFFVNVIGCEHVYSLGPFRSSDDWMATHLNVPADAIMRELRFFRCRNGPNFEIFQYEASGQRLSPPRNSDVGGHHLAFYVDDFGAALAYLKGHGIRLLGEPTYRDTGPSAGQTWIYFLAPWGCSWNWSAFLRGSCMKKRPRPCCGSRPRFCDGNIPPWRSNPCRAGPVMTGNEIPAGHNQTFISVHALKMFQVGCIDGALILARCDHKSVV